MTPSPQSQRGGILLSLAIACFVLSILVASGMAWLLWRDSEGSWQRVHTWWQTGQLPVTTPVVTTSPADALQTSLVVHPDLFSHTVELEQQLRAPLRAYYATKTERLGTIRVEPSDKPEHTTRVTYDLTTTQGTTSHSFYYDRTGEEKDGPYPQWEPGLLDNTE